ncbi:uncharacterized protein HaLaN_03012, partial [Haematococcus lacustris]
MVLYLTSRLSQIYKNWSRKSAEGLSVIMFVFTISANLCTGCSMLLRSRDIEDLQAQAPWLGGAFGTVALDAFIFWQAITYNAVESLAHATEAGRVTAASAAAMAGLPAALQPRRTSQFRYQKLPEQC